MQTQDMTLGDLVTRQPAAAALFEKIGFDYCCGGRQTLADASAERGLDAATVAQMLDALAEMPATGEQGHDVSGASVAELCDHIVTAHHGPLRTSLIRAGDLVATVSRVHGPDHPEVHELADAFAALRGDLEQHMAGEERDLFPAAHKLESSPDHVTLEPSTIALLEDEHEDTGRALQRVRELAGDYNAENAFCATHRALLEQLHAIERDTHQHIHEENNVLFPRVRELAGIAA